MPSNGQNIKICLLIITLLAIPLCFFVLNSPNTFLLWLNDNLLPKPIAFENVAQQKSGKSINKDESGGTTVPLVLLVSYDGFRYDYIEKHKDLMPTMLWMIANGVYAPDGMKNTFITITAPNHYGIVTGLYEESHGIIANDFFDPVLNESFDYFNTRWKTDPRFFGGHPIWNTNDQAGPDRATGCMMWVGCDVPINNQTPPAYRVSYEQSLDWMARVDAVVSWFTHPQKPINFGLLYIEEPDETGHQFGPDSPQIADTLKKIDQLTSYLLWRLFTAGLLGKVDIIFTADHGMAAVPVRNVINMDKFINSSLYTVFGGTPNWNVQPVEGKEQEVYGLLKDKVPHLNVYNKSEIPQDYHYRNSSGIMPLQFVADVHWWIAHNYTANTSKSDNEHSDEIVERVVRGKKIYISVKNVNYTTGEHGYNNSVPDMHPYFLAHGPSFKSGFNVTRQFANIDLYMLMSYLLRVQPAPNNGSFEAVRCVLKDEGQRWSERGGRCCSADTSGQWNVAGADVEMMLARQCLSDFKVDYILMFGLLIFLFLYFWYMSRLSARINKSPMKRDITIAAGDVKTTVIPYGKL